MKKAIVLLCVTAGLLLIPASQVLAFHDHGAARCAGCHTIHNSQDGVAVDTAHVNGNGYLLIKDTPSDVCLSCHATSHGAVWGADPLNPPKMKGGGNFAWLKSTNISDNSHGAAIPGYKGGHNIIAPAMNSGADPVLTHAPGGSYPSSAMSCTSCHDPHGNANFRMLYGIGHVEAGDFTFVNPAPTCQQGPNFSNTTDAESPTLHTAYNGGMSAWCANCHGNYHNNGALLIHPSGVAMGQNIANIYNRYHGTLDQNGGVQATAYIPQVAFEDPTMSPTSAMGPGPSSQVSCITCHRAHGASSPDNGRWDFTIDDQGQDGVVSGYVTALPAPYNNAEQKSLCNKCHNQDAGDLIVP